MKNDHFSAISIKNSLALAKLLLGIEYQNVGYMLRDMPRHLLNSPDSRKDWEHILETLTTKHY